MDIQPGNLSRVSSASKINILQFEGSWARRMSSELLEDRASEDDSLSSAGFLPGKPYFLVSLADDFFDPSAKLQGHSLASRYRKRPVTKPGLVQLCKEFLKGL